MLLRSMPDLSPANTQYRSWFYAHWGRENCLILAHSREAEYERYRQRLSIKMASSGRERYFIDARTVAVDDDNYLILNEGRQYGSVIRSDREVESFSIFFRPGLLDDVFGAVDIDSESMLERSTASMRRSPEFLERLNPHDATVTPVLRFIRHHIRAGVDDERWYEEQLQVLAVRMLVQHRNTRMQALALQCVKPATRVEIYRRMGLAADFIHSCYDRDIGLEHMAAAACLSVHHFMRTFRKIYGVTPMEYLYRKRVRAAERLRDSEKFSMQEIATRVGFNSRATFYRQLQRWGTADLETQGRSLSGS
ncbi:MAG TPA: AraC family transcriptional regulator [Steroidobacteraceae bacterium]|jgi:AraC-like DNA-binding protein